MPDFAARLRRYRESANISQQTLAERCGIDWATQQAYESGERAPDGLYLHALADAVVDVGYLTTGEPSPPLPEGMTPGEFIMLRYFEAASPDERLEVFGLLERAVRRTKDASPTSRASTEAQVIRLAAWRARHDVEGNKL